VTYTSGTHTTTSLTTSIVTVTSCKHGCKPAEPTTTVIPGDQTSVIYSTSTFPVTKTLTSFVPHSSPVFTESGKTYYSTSLSTTHVLTTYISTITNSITGVPSPSTPVSPVSKPNPDQPAEHTPVTPVEGTCPPPTTVYLTKPTDCPPGASYVTVTETVYAGMPPKPTSGSGFGSGSGAHTTETATITLGNGQTTTVVISYTATNTPPTKSTSPDHGSNPPYPTGTGTDNGSHPSPTEGHIKPTGSHVNPTGGEVKPTGTYPQVSGYSTPEHGSKPEWSWPSKYGSHDW
jgi:hypothetical protein